MIIKKFLFKSNDVENKYRIIIDNNDLNRNRGDVKDEHKIYLWQSRKRKEQILYR